MTSTNLRAEFEVDLRPSDLYWFYFGHALARGAVVRRYLGVAMLLEQWDFLAPFLSPVLPYIFVGPFAFSFVV